MAKNFFGIAWILFGVCAIGCLLFSGLAQLIAWSTVFYLLVYTLIVAFFGGFLGFVLERFIGRRKGTISNSAGVVFGILLMVGLGIALLLWALKAPAHLSRGEETLKAILLVVFGEGAIELGRYAVRHRPTASR